MKNLIGKVLNGMVKLIIQMVLGLICMWFILSFKWSLDDMSLTERVIGVVYFFIMIPLYLGIKTLLRLK